MSRIIQFIFFIAIVRPIVYVIIGVNIRNWQRLPNTGPAILVANHNSHLDTLVLMSLLPLKLLPKIRPVAAADYFLRNRALAWFATRIIGIIPIARSAKGGNPLSGCFQALKDDDILILFPEGSRGEPEKMKSDFKQGVRLIARKNPTIPVYPIFLHGLGKSLPKGEAIFVPHFCDVFVGEAISYASEQENFFEKLKSSINELAREGEFPSWD